MRTDLIDMSRVVAPMVSQSDAPFRTLCLKYNASCVYTEMLYSDKIVNDPEYLSAYLPGCDHIFFGSLSYCSRPLVVQICGNDPTIMAHAATAIALTGFVDAVDFNLGCPQKRAIDGHYGSYLLDKCHWPQVFECVKSMANALKPFSIPLFCKIRLIEGANCVDQTTLFCRGLHGNGAKLVAIHGRTRGSAKKRRCGPAKLHVVRAIAENLVREGLCLPVISNGNIRCSHDLEAASYLTAPCVGLMTAEGILRNPSLFLGYTPASPASAERTLCSRVDEGAGGGGGGGGSENIYLALDDDIDGDSTDSDEGACSRCVGMSPPTSSDTPDKLYIFEEYCHLSELYRAGGGWSAMDAYEAQRNINREQSKQIFVARQHLTWMLGKSGHGRLVRFRHRGDFQKHAHLLLALNEANDMAALKAIAARCLKNV